MDTLCTISILMETWSDNMGSNNTKWCSFCARIQLYQNVYNMFEKFVALNTMQNDFIICQLDNAWYCKNS